MARRDNRRKVRPSVTKQRKHETLEPRVVMSADPLLSLHSFAPIDDVPAVTTQAPALTTHLQAPILGVELLESEPAHDPQADFWFEGTADAPADNDLGRKIETTLYEANRLTGQDQVVSKYGFSGNGQTVVVIDTGIAAGHYALGGGVGAGYRVVGGWDFAENDADFYDDQGPKSAHGTHVAGIVGAQGDGIHSGVATDVDLIGLRVFDDAGNGYFHWIEQALQWVHTNRNNYENPVTAVNLSLGTEWNSDSIPSWAMLEDEFALLEADGIFISVSAGNSYANYNAKGLSYPAASDHVIPVMSVDNNGQLSYFSQRAENAIAAPGRTITSTVPDYAGNDADTIDDDWLSMSGTSMAAPYVAGASVLIRQAMEFVGRTNIDQWSIYNHMMSTADTFYDSATSTEYKRLNLAAAIDALMPADDIGNSVVTAHNLGTLNASSAAPLGVLSGVISTLDDVDCFTFVAGATGRVTVSAAQATHELTTQWQAWGATNWTTDANGDCVFDVVAGQTYSFAISTADGLGYYDLSVDLESTFAAIEWGAVGPQETRTGLTVNGEQWYSVTAGRTGYFTAEALAQSGSASVAVYDAQQNLLSGPAAGRVDYQATAGQTLLLRVTGNSANFNLRMTNALTVAAANVTLTGTADDDVIDFSLGGAPSITLNGVQYSFDASAQRSYRINAGDGSDTVTLNGSAADDAIVMRSDVVQMTSGNQGVGVYGAETVVGNGGGGADRAYLYDTAGDESVVSTPTTTSMTGASFTRRANGFAQVFAYASSGYDTVTLVDSAGDDRLTSLPTYSVIQSVSAGYYNFVKGFDAVNAQASQGGDDKAYFYGSAGDDHFVAGPQQASLRDSGGGYLNTASGFEQVFAIGNQGGTDDAILNDSAGDDRVTNGKGYAVMKLATGSRIQVNEFKTTTAVASTGHDEAFLFDTAGDDQLTTTPGYAVLRGLNGSYSNRVEGFDSVSAYASGGYDVSFMYDSNADDVLVASPAAVRLSGVNGSYSNFAAGFDRNNAYASSGFDQAYLSDSAGDDVLTTTPLYVVLKSAGTGYENRANGFDKTYAYATSGNDVAVMYDSAGSDLYVATSAYGSMRSLTTGYWNLASGFGTTTAFSSGGGDRVSLYDTATDDTITGSGSTVTLTAASKTQRAVGFEKVSAYGGAAGVDKINLSVVDYAFEQVGSWA